MADTFPVSGNIDPTSFPHLLVDLHRHGATGSLKVNGPVFPKALYFRGGRILFGSSNDPRDQLGAILIESGKITREQLDDVNAKVGPGNPLAKVLAESGFVNQRELGDAARTKVERILSDVLSWESGSFEFEDGVLPKGAVDLKLSTERLLLAAVQRIGERSWVLRHLGGHTGVVLEPEPEGESALSEVRAEVWPLLERLDGQRTLEDAVALTRLDDFTAAKTACAMLFLRIVKANRPRSADELDLAQEARSGFDDEVPGGASRDRSTEGLPGEASAGFQMVDEGPGSAPQPVGGGEEPFGFVSQAPDEPFGIRDEPLGIKDETVGVSDDGPLGFRAEPEPSTTAEPEPAGFSMPEPTGFTMAESEPASFGAELGIDAPPPFPEPEEPAPPRVDEARTAPPASGEATGFAFVEGEAEPPPTLDQSPQPLAVPSLPDPSPQETPLPTAADLASPPPRRPGIDTVPGDRPLYVPPPAPPREVAPPPPPEPPPPAPAPSTNRPSREDLAALDALLNPSASQRIERSVTARPRTARFEPQFRPPSSGRMARPRVPPKRARGSRMPVVAGAAGLLVVLLAGAYFALNRPTEPAAAAAPPPTTRPRAVSTPALSAPATVAAAPSPAATTDPGAAFDPGGAEETPAPGVPSDEASATAEPTAAAPAPTPAAALPTPVAPPPSPPKPAATPTPSAAAAPPGADPRALLREGALAGAARGFATSLGPGPADRFSVQAIVACAPETVQKAAANVAGEELFILPVELEGRECYRVCWGVFGTREEAEAAAQELPAYFRQSGLRPRVTPLDELLP